jgi:prophage DNA circulation protein
MAHQEHTEGAPMSAPDPWHRRPGESNLAYRAFVLYLFMSPKRSLAKLARKDNRGRSDRPDAGLTQLKKWSSRWGWQDRVTAYDDEQARLDIAYHDRDKLIHLAHDKALNVALEVLAEADRKTMTEAEAVAVIDKIERIERNRQSRDQPVKKSR